MPSAYDIKKAKERAEADAKKYASVDTAKQGQHHTSNYQGMALRRKQKMESETGIFDIHGRRVQPQRPKKPYYLANFQPKITLLSQQEEQLKHQQQLERSQRRAVQKEKERRQSLTDNIKGALARDYDTKSALKIDDRRCYKYIRMLKSGTPRSTVEKLMVKALGSEGFHKELLDNWQNKLLCANKSGQTTNRSNARRNGKKSKKAYLKNRLRFQETEQFSSVDQHEMQMIARNNNVIQLVVTYVIYLLQQQEGRARDLFAKLDTSGDGNLSQIEFNQGLNQLGFTLAKEESRHLFQAIDDDDSGDIEIREFVRLLRQPLQPVHITDLELLDGMRKLEVVITQTHAKAVHTYLTSDHPGIDVGELHTLIMSPKDLHSLDPSPGLNLHPTDIAGRPKHQTYRFSNPLLSTAMMDDAEMKAKKDRALLHKTIKRLENALVGSAIYLWRSKVIDGLHSNLKRMTSVKVKKEKVDSVREINKKMALAEYSKEDLSDQNHGGPLSDTTTMNAKIAMARIKRLKTKKQKQALENIQKLDQTSIATRPSWNTSMMFPYRYRQMATDEIPCLGRMFKPMSFWRQGCNPKVNVPKKPSVTKNKQHKLMHRQHKMRQELEKNTTISTFSKHAQYVSPQFKRHLQRPGMSAPTPEAGGFYVPPTGIKQNFPHLTRFFTGGNAKRLVRAFMKYETPL